MINFIYGVITINSNEVVKSSTFWVQIISVFLIILAYLTSRSLVFVAGGICMLFLLTNTGWEQKFSLMFFLFPFCWVFTYKADTTSIYMLLRIAIIISVFFYNRKIITTNFVLTCIIMVFYLSAISFGNFSGSVKNIINMMLWLTIGYVMQATVDGDSILPISRSFSNGLIISGIVGMNLKYIPELEKVMRDIEILGYGGRMFGRFAGLFCDPNFFSVMVCVALWSAYYEFNRGKYKIGEYCIRTLLITFFGAMTMSKSCILLLALYWIYVLFAYNNIKITGKISIVLIVGITFSYFIISNPDWFQNIIFRFFGRKLYHGGITANDITTGRTDIWLMYLEYLYYTNVWFWGTGLSGMLLRGVEAHNTILQMLYSVGLVGSFLIYKFFKMVYVTCPTGKKTSGFNRIGIFALLFVAASLFFLSGLQLEIYYYMLPICFIYTKNYVIDDTVQ